MIGTCLNQYQITAKIGQGGMGEVFRARDKRLSRDVAVKVLPKEFAMDPDRLRRFEQEANTLAALNHPNVLTVFDAGVHEGAPYLVSELLEGKTLREAMKPGRWLCEKPRITCFKSRRVSLLPTARESSIATLSPRIFSLPKTAGSKSWISAWRS
jgi:serine/threonine protein kinase